jgi:hypothetical protein
MHPDARGAGFSRLGSQNDQLSKLSTALEAFQTLLP